MDYPCRAKLNAYVSSLAGQLENALRHHTRVRTLTSAMSDEVTDAAPGAASPSPAARHRLATKVHTMTQATTCTGLMLLILVRPTDSKVYAEMTPGCIAPNSPDLERHATRIMVTHTVGDNLPVGSGGSGGPARATKGPLEHHEFQKILRNDTYSLSDEVNTRWT